MNGRTVLIAIVAGIASLIIGAVGAALVHDAIGAPYDVAVGPIDAPAGITPPPTPSATPEETVATEAPTASPTPLPTVTVAPTASAPATISPITPPPTFPAATP